MYHKNHKMIRKKMFYKIDLSIQNFTKMFHKWDSQKKCFSKRDFERIDKMI